MKDVLIHFGDEVKIADNGQVSGYLVRFTDADMPDLEGDFFTPETDFDFEDERQLSIYYHHGLNPTLGNRKIGKARVKKDEVGVFIEGQLALRDEYERAIKERLIDAQKTGWSSGAVSHLARFERQQNGTNFIKSWPIGEASITPTPAAGPDMTKVIPIKSLLDVNPEALEPKVSGDDTAGAEEPTVQPEQIKSKDKEKKNMSEQDNNTPAVDIEAIVAKASQDAAAAAVEQAMKAFEERQKQESEPKPKPDNDPGYAKNFNIGKYPEVRQYDHYSIEDLGWASDVVKAAGRDRKPEVVKSLALRLESSEVQEGKKLFDTFNTPYKAAAFAMQRANIKADETNFSTNANYGDEWIGVAYSGELWEKVRTQSQVVEKLVSEGSTFEFPPGAESMTIPLEGTDPIWYLVAQAGDPTSSTAQVTNTVPAKALGTANASMTLGKLGSSTIYTGEMVEDAVLMFAPTLRRQIAVSGSEYLESAIIDGDTATTTVTNINDIAGTPGSTDWFLIWNGFRKSPLVTTTANSRDGGVLTSADFLETVKLMGASGKTGFDRMKVSFILPPPTHWKALELADLKTRDVYANPTLENGNLVRIWGYDVMTSYFYNFASTVNSGNEYKENTAGKIDLDTGGNNTKGSILAVRWDHWKLGFRRRMTTEVERIPRADAYEITTLMRAGLVQRGTEASAITYNLTV